MKLWKKSFLSIIFIATVLFPTIGSPDLLGNGGKFVEGNLKTITTNASINTLQAFSDFYRMISEIEDPKKVNADIVSAFGEKITAKIGTSITDLTIAKSLKDSEFYTLDSYIKTINFEMVRQRYEIPPQNKIWIEVVEALKKTGGRGWLDQNILLNSNLVRKTKEFVEIYKGKPTPILVWNLDSEWRNEFNRGKFLSMTFYSDK